MAEHASSPERLAAARREQMPQALARLVVVELFTALWFVLWLARIPMPLPFLVVLGIEAAFFVVYIRFVVPALPTETAIRRAHYIMLLAEILFHTAMVYFLGLPTWLGAFAYMFGLIFANTFLDMRRGFVYTAGVATAFTTLLILDATNVIPHYSYLEEGGIRYDDPRLAIDWPVAPRVVSARDRALPRLG